MSSRDRSAARAAVPLVLLGLLAPAASSAMDANLGVAFSSIYTDNLQLTPTNEDSDLVFLLDPTLNLTDTGSRYQFQLQYQMQVLYFTNQDDSNSIFNIGDANLEMELLKEHLFLGTNANIQQVTIDPTKPITFSNVPVISNRTDATTLSASPEWRQKILGNDLDLNYSFGHINYADKSLQDVDYQTIESDLVSPEKERGLSWAVHHEYFKYTYDFPPDATQQMLDLSLFWNMAGGWAPYGSIGLESNADDRTDPSLKDGIWAVGVRRSVERLKFDVSFGKRSFGNTWAASMEKEFGSQQGNFVRLAYVETPQTAESISLTETRPKFDPQNPVLPPGIVVPGSGDYFIEKTGTADLGLGFSRLKLSAGYFYDRTSGQQDAADNQYSETRQNGGQFRAQYALGPKTELAAWALLSYRRFEQPSGFGCGDTICTVDTDHLFRAQLAVRYDLGPRTKVGAYVQRQQQDGSEIPENNYTENEIGVSIERNFF